jgi:hypothetical protein
MSLRTMRVNSKNDAAFWICMLIGYAATGFAAGLTYGERNDRQVPFPTYPPPDA